MGGWKIKTIDDFIGFITASIKGVHFYRFLGTVKIVCLLFAIRIEGLNEYFYKGLQGGSIV